MVKNLIVYKKLLLKQKSPKKLSKKIFYRIEFCVFKKYRKKNLLKKWKFLPIKKISTKNILHWKIFQKKIKHGNNL